MTADDRPPTTTSPLKQNRVDCMLMTALFVSRYGAATRLPRQTCVGALRAQCVTMVCLVDLRRIYRQHDLDAVSAPASYGDEAPAPLAAPAPLLALASRPLSALSMRTVSASKDKSGTRRYFTSRPLIVATDLPSPATFTE